MNTTDIKFRPKLQTFSTKTGCRAFFCIQVRHGGKWSFLGDASGIFRYETQEKRDDKLDAVRKSALAVPPETAP